MKQVFETIEGPFPRIRRGIRNFDLDHRSEYRIQSMFCWRRTAADRQKGNVTNRSESEAGCAGPSGAAHAIAARLRQP
jgi:hypothetical protein